jgi:hydroxymethylpyrimidine pyrophosphatase-like HAD family hydrolase
MPQLQAHPLRPRVSVQPNRDRIDVVPAGVDKAAGLRRLLRDRGLAATPRLSVGDGENDLPVFAMAARSVAVANAAAIAKQAAGEVAPAEASKGFLWAVAPLLGEPATAEATAAVPAAPRTAPP